MPSFQNTIEGNRLSSLNDSLINFLRGARGEALSRSITVTICPSDDQNTCSGTWSDGWIMFVDEDADRILDAASDELLKTGTASLGGYTVSLISDVSTAFQFSGDGRANNSGTYQICSPAKANADAVGIVIQSSGSLRYAADTDGDGIRETHLGGGLSC